MKAWTWIKSLGWLVALGTILTAVVFAMAGLKSAREQGRVADGEARIEKLKFDKTMKGINNAAKLQVKVDKGKQKVIDADKKMEEALEKLGDGNESMDVIADRFNSKRVRREA